MSKRLKELQKMIDAGTYNVPAEKIAEKLLKKNPEMSINTSEVRMTRIVFYEEGYINLTKPNMQCRPIDMDRHWWTTVVDTETFHNFMAINCLKLTLTKELISSDGRTWGIVQ